MIYSPHFGIQELVCKHVYDKYGEFSWNFLDIRLIVTINLLREKIDKPIYLNDYEVHGEITQKGLRCPQCQIVKDYILKGILYMSGHVLGKAGDLKVIGMEAQEVREYIINNEKILPYAIRLEDNVSWTHIDLMNNTDKKVILFNK